MQSTFSESNEEKLNLYHEIFMACKENCSHKVKEGYLTTVSEGKHTNYKPLLLKECFY